MTDLLARFLSPGPEYSPLPIWWWSGAKVTAAGLRRQMEQLVSQGVRQAVVLCLAPTGPMFGALADDPPFLSPEWIELLDGACADAQELGFHLWMYDQIGFSGANFQGRLTTANPEFAGIALHRGDNGEIGTRISGFDYFGVDACAALLDQVHGALERGVGHWFGTVIPGFFQDELPAMPTWGRDFAETFTAHYGYEIELPALYSGGEARSARIRRDYHEHRARLARRAFFDPLDNWFAQRNLLCGFDQPSPAREGDPVGAVGLYGDYLGTHSGFTAPGSDHWGDPKVHSSLAHANGHERTWIEAFHSSGWGGTLEETYDWLAPFLRRGANLYDPHAVYYSTVGGWWEWAPPSTCWRQPYWPAYHHFATAVSRLCAVLSAGTHVCDTVLLSPTSTAQAYLTLDGPLPPAERANSCYHLLNGESAWFAEKRGILERAGIDHDTLDENTIAAATVHNGLRINEETYRTVIVPDVELLHPDCAAKLAEFAAAGGQVICVGKPVVDGAVTVAEADEVPELIAPGPVTADAPFLLRRNGDDYVLLLTAHDERSGTRAPIVSLDEQSWFTTGFPWEEYWRQLRTNGYAFVPPADRVATVRIGDLATRAQRWNPRTGERTELPVREGVIEVAFTDGPMSLVIIGEDLPEADTAPRGAVAEVIPVEGPWRALAESTVDNSYGDFASAQRGGVLPIEVWRFQHAEGEALAGYGPFAEVRTGDGAWQLAEWSLARGIRKDPAHNETLGPKGYVPEEFLDWRQVARGERVEVRTTLRLPDRQGLYLAVGSGAERTVFVDEMAVPGTGAGYQSMHPLEHTGRTVRLRIEFRAEHSGPVRASFAVITDPEAYRRPEWLSGKEVRRTFTLDAIPGDTTIQVSSQGACTVMVNGVELGKQGDFNPYPGFREIRVHPYDVAEQLRVGENTITLRLGPDTSAAFDGLGMVSGAEWEASGLHREHERDPRFICATARPHPLPGAHWLEPGAAQGTTVLPLIPDIAPGGERLEILHFPAPLGTTDLRIPTDLGVLVRIGDKEYHPVDQRIRLPAPLAACTEVEMRFRSNDGRRMGAVLDAPIEVRVAEAETGLLSWEQLGLRALAGTVSYRTTFTAPDGQVQLDLGEVRGTADILLNGTLVDQLVWGPWRTDITDALHTGRNELEIVVRGTLAGYLDDASPTTAVAAGQVHTGLFGPVRLLRTTPHPDFYIT